MIFFRFSIISKNRRLWEFSWETTLFFQLANHKLKDLFNRYFRSISGSQEFIEIFLVWYESVAKFIRPDSRIFV